MNASPSPSRFDPDAAPEAEPSSADREALEKFNCDLQRAIDNVDWSQPFLMKPAGSILDTMTTMRNDAAMAKQRAVRVSDQLRRIIEECGLSRYEISKRTGIDEGTLSKFIYGERGLSMKALDRLGECLGLTVNMRRNPGEKR